MNHTQFAPILINWQRQHGRRNLPWQVQDPYRIWLSEIMLQQTQVATVCGYYPRFIEKFPTVADLAAAEQDEVLALWAGLGYYSRARNLHKAARQVVEQFGGRFPQSRQELETLCGVGRSTAAAISAFAFGQRETILDGNVKRILCRIFARDGNPADKKFEQSLWTLAESLMPSENQDMPAYTQGLMDLGATVCKRSKPLCGECPMSSMCEAKKQNRIDELPRRKAAVNVQTLPLYWLTVRNQDNKIWLHKREQGGIWGGLYCVPCFESLDELHRFADDLGLNEGDLSEDTPFTHRLTHRLLLITPFTATCPNPPFSDGLWVAPQDLADYGLPKPLQDYLHRKQGRLF
ncbi:A/G-specific adenine glycosylase [Neisseria sp. ZJ106]|uniref:Adenine DNA glycosylase n=1 Tax=Neisseria lisongii TaxID=2912188 RepID=A0ABY7RLU4_9NEIS|nr:A/G-specific adenine glycosylase [Neisseria lisongii]MCF7521824.1 A/G-specific adenine glycosylase [Neisseria lisongii]WCL72198.1 A/G-specific adenine glycosylase [Neisseria lisongii]